MTEFLLPATLLILAIAVLVAAIIFARAAHATAARREQAVGALQATASNLSTTTALEKQVQEREQVNAALRERERKYRSIFENALIGIAQIAPAAPEVAGDATATQGGRWLTVNPALARMLGFFDPSELLSAQPDLQGNFFVRAEDRAQWFNLLASDKPQAFEADVWRLDHKKIRLAFSGAAVRDEAGRILYYEAMMVDITERYLAEQALLLAKEQAEYANRSKSDFLANMSHELRTPLNAIIGFAEIIKDQLFGPIGNTQYSEYAKDIFDSGQHLLSLINDILDMSKVEAGKRELAEENVSLYDTAQSAVRLIAHRAKSGRVKLNVEIEKSLPRIRAEEKALKQILVNLLSNAVKFTPEGGSVTLSAAPQINGDLKIAVTDTGIGIAPEDIQKALAPFGQIESALSRKYQGTGLGLPITKGLVELHGGILELTSKLGEGTVVAFTLPAARVIKE